MKIRINQGMVSPMAVVKCFNAATGNCETVSNVFPEELSGFKLALFASADTNTDHVYYVATVSE